MVAILYQQRKKNKNMYYNPISAEDSWRAVIDEWLLTDKISLPDGKYLIVQGDTIAEFILTRISSGEKFLELQRHISLSNIYNGGVK